MTFSGLVVTAPSWVSEMDEVLLARMVSGRVTPAQLFKQIFFDRVVFRGGFDDQLHIPHIGQIAGAAQTLLDSLLFLGGQRAAVGETDQVALDVGQRAINQIGRHIVQQDRKAGLGGDLSDAAAHLTGTDNTERVNSHNVCDL